MSFDDDMPIKLGRDMLGEWSRMVRVDLHDETDHVLDFGTETADVLQAIDMILITADKRYSRTYTLEERKYVVEMFRRWSLLAAEAKQSLKEVSGDGRHFFFIRASQHVEDALKRDHLH